VTFDSDTSVVGEDRRERESTRMDEEGEMDPVVPIGLKLHFHMQIDERISKNFSSRHSFFILYHTQS
jgi:hypothetical protein